MHPVDERFPRAALHFNLPLEHHRLVLRRGVVEIDSGLVKWSLDPFGSTKNEVIVASMEFAYDTVRRVL